MLSALETTCKLLVTAVLVVVVVMVTIITGTTHTIQAAGANLGGVFLLFSVGPEERKRTGMARFRHNICVA